MYTYLQERAGLSYFYPKRKVLADGMSTAPQLYNFNHLINTKNNHILTVNEFFFSENQFNYLKENR
jgi:hypothetical protein